MGLYTAVQKTISEVSDYQRLNLLING